MTISQKRRRATGGAVARRQTSGQSGAKGDQPEPRNGKEFLQGLERGFAVLKAFSARAPSLTMTQVAQKVGLPRAVARRYLFTLEVLGYVARDQSNFSLTPRVLDFGFTYLSTIGVAEIARPFMLRVVETLHESCSIGVLDGQDVVYVARMPADRIMTTNLAVGSRLPAHATAMGKVLLAYLTPAQLQAYFAAGARRALTERTACDERTLRATLKIVRERGWAGNDEESEKGVRTVAVPLYDRSGFVVAAINLAGHSSRVSMKELTSNHLPVLLEAARDISQRLGAQVGDGADAAPRFRAS